MKKISSNMTFVSKWLVPFVLVTFFTTGAAFEISHQIRQFDCSSLVTTLILGVFGFFMLKYTVFDLVDEVWDAGDRIIIRDAGEEWTIPFAEILNVSYALTGSPPRVTLHLRQPDDHGDEISFIPEYSWIPFRKSPQITDLIRRIDRARAETNSLKR